MLKDAADTGNGRLKKRPDCKKSQNLGAPHTSNSGFFCRNQERRGTIEPSPGPPSPPVSLSNILFLYISFCFL